MRYFFSGKMRHFFITRLNVAMGATKERTDDKRLDLTWLDRKLALLSEITIPSMKNQSTRDFTWLMLVDEKTPSPFVEKIREIGHKIFDLVLCQEDWHQNLWNISNGPVITTRLDTDDAIHKDFAAKVRATALSKSAPTVIDFPSGILLKEGAFLRRYKTENQFTSLFAPVGTRTMIYSFGHAALMEAFPSYEIVKTEQPMWLLTNHKDSYTKGSRARPDEPYTTIENAETLLRKEFGVDPPRIIDLMNDRFEFAHP